MAKENSVGDRARPSPSCQGRSRSCLHRVPGVSAGFDIIVNKDSSDSKGLLVHTDIQIHTSLGLLHEKLGGSAGDLVFVVFGVTSSVTV